MEDPLALLEELIGKKVIIPRIQRQVRDKVLEKGIDYVILPLYSTRGKKDVPVQSGLNQWNAGGRKRNANEIYIPIPRIIHKKFPQFFPDKENPFTLRLPDGSLLSTKICQANGKALMSNPNSALGDWMLRKVLKVKEGELVTMDMLNLYGIDSIMIRKTSEVIDDTKVYEFFFSNGKYESYEQFINEDEVL